MSVVLKSPPRGRWASAWRLLLLCWPGGCWAIALEANRMSATPRIGLCMGCLRLRIDTTSPGQYKDGDVFGYPRQFLRRQDATKTLVVAVSPGAAGARRRAGADPDCYGARDRLADQRTGYLR